MANRVRLALALALVLLAGASGATAATAPAARSGAKRTHGSRRRSKPPPSQVSLAPSAAGVGVPVTMAPVGLSLEYPIMAEDLGSGPCPPPALVAQLQQLGSPPLSLEGDSQDLTVPSGVLSGAPQSWEAATLYTLPVNFWNQLHCLLSASKDPLTVGVNARTGALSWAQQMVAGANSAATNGLDFAVGNEPDLYPLPNYAALDHPQAEEEALAVDTYLEVAAQLQPALGAAPTIGPELAGPAHWRRQVPRVISQLHLQTVGVHMYPLSSCVTPRAVTVRGLLSSLAGKEPHNLAWVVADASAAGVPAIVSEANSSSCGGVAGVSDSPASAVWAVRFVLSALLTGLREVRFHFSGGPYDPFVVSGEQVLTRPLDSALVALNRWLPVGASLHALAGVRGLVATSVREPTGTGMVILDNESGRRQRVVVRGAAAVTVQTLSAARDGLATSELHSARERVELTVAANSVVAVSPASSPAP